jgi:glutathione S-transferase
MYKLHAFSQSGNAYKVAVLLQALRQPWTAVHMPFSDFAGGVPRSDAWRQDVNPMGELPILEDGHRKLTQSAAILLYLAAKHGEYGGQDDDERQEVMRWLFFDNHKFTSYFASWRFTKSFAPAPPDPSLEKWLRGRIDNAFGIAERHFERHPYVVGSAPTIADMSMCGYMYFPPEESGYDFAKQYPAIARWSERLKSLPGWKPPYELLPGERIAPKW